MKKLTLLIVVSIILFPVFSQEQPAGLKRFAIFAGSNDGGMQRVRLEYAETDALSMYQVLSDIGGLSSSDSIIVTDAVPENIQSAFDNMKLLIDREKGNSRRTEFFFYYSGHSDEMGILPGGELFNYSDLRFQIDAMGTDVKVAVLDSCSSGSFTRLKGGIKKAPFLIDESVDTTGHAFLTSSSENEAAQESDLIEGSFFTHYLISALRGAADNTQDGTVTLNEAYSFAADETLERTTSSIAGAQHPSYSINLTGSGDLVLTDLREVISTISIDKDIDGRIFFRDDSDHLVVEFRKRAGIPVSISLPAGVYKVDLETDSGLTTSIITVHKGEIALKKSNFTEVERTFARSRGNEVDIAVEPEKSTPGEILDNTIESVEESLEMKMKEIRSIIADKFSKEMDREINESHDDIDISPNDIPGESDRAEDVVRTDLEYSVFGVSATPSSWSANDVRNISLNFIGKPYGINGFALGFMNMTYADVYGAQIAAISNQTGRDHYGFLSSGVYNIVERDLWGFASSGVFNITKGKVFGAQISGVFNISASELNGFQASGVFNITENFTNGAQASGVFNITDGAMNGIQASGVFNVARGVMNGVQASGVFNLAEGQLRGVQASGIFNVADNINGIQMSLVNVGKQVNGMQIGLININDDINGLPIGLLTISKNGIMDLGGWYESSGFFYTGIQTGSRNFYNIAYMALPVDNQGSVLVTGFGIGARINLGPLYIDIDGSVKNVAPGTDAQDAIRQTFARDQFYSLFPSARLSAGLKIFGFMSVFGGLSMDIHIPGYTERSGFFHNSAEPWIINNPDSGLGAFEIHPKWFAGLKINM